MRNILKWRWRSLNLKGLIVGTQVLVVFPRDFPDYCKTFPKLFKQLCVPSPPFTRYCIKKKKEKNRQSSNDMQILVSNYW